jgi:hypothetical protein
MPSKSRTPGRGPQSESALRHLPLVDLLVDTKTDHPGAAEGLREGLDETLTGLSTRETAERVA